MAKARPKISSPRKNPSYYALRLRSRVRLRKNVRQIKKGFVYIQTSENNTIISVTDLKGQVVCWDSAGTSRFKGPRRGTPFAAQIATRNALYTLIKQGMKQAGVILKGYGYGRQAALRAVLRSGLKVIFIRDATRIPHNGCRPPNRRRR